MPEKPYTFSQGSLDSGVDFLSKPYQGVEISEEDAKTISEENERLAQCLIAKQNVRQNSCREREEVVPIITDRLARGLEIENENEYRIFMNMVQTFHPNAKFPTFSAFQSFVAAHQKHSLGGLEVASFYDEQQEKHRTDRIAIQGRVDSSMSFEVGYFDIKDGIIHPVEISQDVRDLVQYRREMYQAHEQEEEEWNREAQARFDLETKKEYAPPYVLHPQEWKERREDRIKNIMDRKTQARMAEGFSTDADYAAIGRIENTYIAFMDDAEQKALHDRYIDAARTAWEETSNEEEFYARMAQIDQSYPDVELFMFAD